ncbi:helix-turn-helix transcriptional regulator [Phenylobacterium sp. LjRoot164]|uniref:LuxR C-terminal-related transcriptional regulator n=1 Tax=unclassified Phenylobacterium TaxID=2640670 RepID=UPI003ECE7392
MTKPILTRRQRDCLRLVAKGKTSIQIGAEFNISFRTVDQYIGDAGRRLGARNRAQGVAEAVRRGEI